MGYVHNGIYHDGSPPESVTGTDRTQMSRQYGHDMQRADHRADLVQPYNHDGTINPDFVNLYPEESKLYGFVPGEKDGKSQE